MSDESVRIEYIALSKLKRWERNPKDHDLGELGRSLSRFGFVMPILIDERSGTIAAGHGRVDALLQRKALGEAPPARVKADGDEWRIPVIRGISFNSDGEVEAYGVADNRLVERGGWDETALTAVLQDLAEGPGLDGTGYDGDDLDALLAFTSMMGEFEKLPDLEWDAGGGGTPAGYLLLSLRLSRDDVRGIYRCYAPGGIALCFWKL